MNYPQPIERLLNDQAYRRYATTTDGTEGVLGDLQALNVKAICGTSRPTARPTGDTKEMANACISGLWLLHNFLEQSHQISQSIQTPVGSHWHAIVHRLEGDFSNSKYWYRRAGDRSLYDRISDSAGQKFDPILFVDRVQNAGCEPTHDLAVTEWQVLFEYCYRRATDG